jgi:CheY-like chemotaxis protein/HPt (histidine-containing phosphotransfer) domain-containing protein
MRALSILVAEDNAVNLRLVKLNLEGWGHRITTAEDGLIAVNKYKAGNFDLVLTDLQMPNLSGFEAAMEMRKFEKMEGRSRTPILALSANVLKGVRDECTNAGMDGYVSKPVRQQELMSAMSAVIPDLFNTDAKIAHKELRAEAQPETPISRVIKLASVPQNPEHAPVAAFAPVEPAVLPSAAPVSRETEKFVILPPPAEAKPLFDAEVLMANLGGDLGMLAEVIKLCREGDVPRLLKDLRAALDKGDAAQVGRTAHGMKGMVGAFNATEAWAKAKQLETSGMTGKTDVLHTEAEELVASVRALVIELEKFAGIDHEPLVW